MGGSSARSAPRLAVVSFYGHDQMTPRGARTSALVAALERDWNVELFPAGTAGPAPSRRTESTRLRRLAARAVVAVLTDRFELRGRLALRRWAPDADGALLIGYPFSPLAEAARRLRRRRIRYVVDLGDPWALTARHPVVSHLGLRRARKAEWNLWNSAAGGIVTTACQAEALRQLFPELPLLVRPNGYSPIDHGAPFRSECCTRSQEVLRLAHFGDISSARIDVRRALADLVESGPWASVEFHQFGADWTGTMTSAHPAVTTVIHPRLPWAEAVEAAGTFDAAVVIGNRDPCQLPSKAVDYLTLPVPRIALSYGGPSDALAGYVADKPGWIVVRRDERDRAGARVHRHLARDWTAAELAPPASEAWPCVADEISSFLAGALGAAVQPAVRQCSE